MYRPKPYFIKRKDGKKCLNPPYKSYLNNLIKMSPHERAEWKNIGVHVTGAREKRIVDYYGSIAFLEMPIRTS